VALYLEVGFGSMVRSVFGVCGVAWWPLVGQEGKRDSGEGERVLDGG
jgi:hypothetical protein